MTKKLELHFDKWRDPYGDNIEDVEFPGFSRVKKKASTANDDEYSQTKEDDEDVMPSRPLSFIATSMGHIPMTEYTSPSKIFNFWVGHTNFDITGEVFDAIEETEGVEILTVFTRYRFRIGIGKQFEDGTVMRDIRKSVFKLLKQK